MEQTLKMLKQQELDTKLQMEQKERHDRLAMEERIKTKEIEAKVQIEKDKLQKHGLSGSSSQINAIRILDLFPNLRLALREKCQ